MTLRVYSLSQRLTTTVLAFALIVWGFTLAISWTMTDHELNELLDAHLAQAAALLASGAVENRVTDQDSVRQAAILMHKYQSRVAFQIWQGGRLRARSADAPEAMLAQPGTLGLSTQLLSGTAWRVFSVAPAGDPGGGVIHVGEKVSARRHVLLASLRGALLPLLLALPFLAIGIAWTVPRALRPLRQLRDTVAARRPVALDPLPEGDVPPEVRPLVQALNALFGRVAEQMEIEHRFTADAAHELRTPIAAIRMQAQVAQGATSDEQRAEALAATIAGCDRATHLMDQLLLLARLDADVAGEALRGGEGVLPVDLVAVVADRVAELAPMALTRAQRIQLVAPDYPVPVHMRATLLAVLVRNLLDNALRYGPNEKKMVVRIRPPTAGKGIELTVEDAGPGLSDAAIGRLGERFFRQVGSTASGSGLGWSIVQHVARLHGLRLVIDRSPGLGGLRVRVQWPGVP